MMLGPTLRDIEYHVLFILFTVIRCVGVFLRITVCLCAVCFIWIPITWSLISLLFFIVPSSHNNGTLMTSTCLAFVLCQSVCVYAFHQFYFRVNQTIPIAWYIFLKNNSSRKGNIYFHSIINILYIFITLSIIQNHVLLYIFHFQSFTNVPFYFIVSHSKPYCWIWSSICSTRSRENIDHNLQFTISLGQRKC